MTGQVQESSIDRANRVPSAGNVALLRYRWLFTVALLMAVLTAVPGIDTVAERLQGWGLPVDFLYHWMAGNEKGDKDVGWFLLPGWLGCFIALGDQIAGCFREHFELPGQADARRPANAVFKFYSSVGLLFVIAALTGEEMPKWGTFVLIYGVVMTAAVGTVWAQRFPAYGHLAARMAFRINLTLALSIVLLLLPVLVATVAELLPWLGSAGMDVYDLLKDSYDNRYPRPYPG